jgi:hypothetical protein
MLVLVLVLLRTVTETWIKHCIHQCETGRCHEQGYGKLL